MLMWIWLIGAIACFYILMKNCDDVLSDGVADLVVCTVLSILWPLLLIVALIAAGIIVRCLDWVGNDDDMGA